MKKLYVLVLVAGLMILTSTDAMACWGFSSNSKQHRYRQQNTERQVDPGAVEAPLDGGLLAILAAAGGAYFVARKKKKNQQ